jgi:hypothetical protein
MRKGTSQVDMTLLDILIDGFEKNEVLDGFHWRKLPMPDETSAVRKVTALIEEARRWKGVPSRVDETGPRRIAAWPDLEIRQAGRGILIRIRPPWPHEWWHADDTWEGEPLAAIHAWLHEEESEERTA